MAASGFCLFTLILPLASGSDPTVIGTPIISFPRAGNVRVQKLQKDGVSWLRLRGLQYAEHPVGELRWRPPVALKPISLDAAPRDATSWGPDCVQGRNLKGRIPPGGLVFPWVATSESCLLLNVWAPEPAGDISLPVLFWIHGGSFRAGGTTQYGGDDLMAIRQGALYVTSNYRLGAFGFLGGAAIARSSGDGSSGNFATQDNREALRWVQQNIAAIGGDRTRVTIFGQSSGGSQVALHIVSPRSWGLFSGAIMESGSFDNFTMQTNPEEVFQRFSSEAGCDKTGNSDDALACLKKLPLNQDNILCPLRNAVVDTGEAALYGPVVDGIEMTGGTEELARKGKIAPMKGVMLGTASHEGRFMMPITNPMPGAPYSTLDQLLTFMKSMWPGGGDAILKLYPLDGFTPATKYWELAAQAYTDQQYFCPARRSAQWLAASSGLSADRIFVYESTYAPSHYLFLRLFDKYKNWCFKWYWWLPCAAMNEDIGAGHASEIDMVWGSKYLNATEKLLAYKFISWWQQFANSTAPNAVDGVQWTAFGNANATMILQPNPVMANGPRAQICDFWDTYTATSARREEHMPQNTMVV